MKIMVKIGTKTVVLVSPDKDEEIELDDVTTINYSNLYGEAVTVSGLLNKVGLMKVEYEKKAKEEKLFCDVFAANLRKKLRREAATNGGRITIDGESFKLTEKGLEDAILLNEQYQKNLMNLIEIESKRDKLDTLFWAVQSKDKKLNNLLPKIVPQDFEKELIEGKINTFKIVKTDY